MPTRLEWIDPETGEASALTWDAVRGGAASDTIRLDLWNDRDATGAGTASALRLRLLARPQGSTTWRAHGLALLDLRGLQVRILGGSSVAGPVAPTGWQPLGTDRTVSLPDLASGDRLETEWRVSLPAGAGTDTLDLRVRLDAVRSEPLPDGVREIAGDGVLVGVGDPRVAEIVHVDGAPAADGVDTVTLPDVAWTVGGRPGVALGGDLVLDATDADGDALQGEGGEVEAYFALVSLGADGLVVTKGAKALAPLDVTSRPTPPAGHLPWLLIERPLDGIDSADITQLAMPRCLAIVATAGRIVTVAPGAAVVNGRRVDPGIATQLDIPADSTVTVWLLADGSLVAAADRPEPGALALHRLNADASTITESIDRRRFLGPGRQRVDLTLDATVGASATWWHNGAHDVGLHLGSGGGGVGLRLHDATGATSGAWTVDVEAVGVGTWWGSDPTRRPSIAFDGAPTTRTLPEIAIVPAGALVRATVVETPPDGATSLSVAFTVWDIPDLDRSTL